MQETWVQSLGWEDPLEKGMGHPLQYSGLENPRDRGAWWATVRGVTASDTPEQLTQHTNNFSSTPLSPSLSFQEMRNRS